MTKKYDWMKEKWRPMMGWTYMVTCIVDFIIFPVAWVVLQAYLKQPITQWDPLTLKGAGLYHLAMGAVLGVAAWTRGQEKISAMTTGYNTDNSSYLPSTRTPYTPQPIQRPTPIARPRPSTPIDNDEMPPID